MNTHIIGFYEEMAKNYINYCQISSNTHLICSSEVYHHPVASFRAQSEEYMYLVIIVN